MVNSDEIYPPSPFIRSEDLQEGKTYEATITGWKVEEFEENGKPVKKIVLNLEGFTKRLVLNKTNKEIIKSRLNTSETSDWVNAKISFTKIPIKFRGEIKDSIKIQNVVR